MKSTQNPRGAGRKPLKEGEHRKMFSLRLKRETIEIIRESGGTPFVEAAILEKKEKTL
jgi:hypothetical protein